MTNRDYFAKAIDAPKPDVGKKEWGGTVGGPIIRNKLHFFGSLERLYVNRNFTNTFPRAPRSTSRSRAKNRRGTRCGASTIS